MTDFYEDDEPREKIKKAFEGGVKGVTAKPLLGEPVAYLLHEGMGNYRVVEAREFDVAAHRRLDPLPLFKCPRYPHDRGLTYDKATDEGVCLLCGYRTVIEMGWA